MTTDDKSVGLFQDILSLEKEYNYNILQLKLKEEEIERYKHSNITLQGTINKNLDEIKRLKADLRSLEDAMDKISHRREEEKGICEDVINKLTTKINEVRGQHKVETEKAENETKRRFDELERVHTRSLDEKNKSYMLKIGELQSDLQQSMSTITRLNTQIQQLMDDNMNLQNKIRETESKYIPEITIYKNEVNLLKRSNADLSAGLESHKREHSKLTENISHLLSKIEDIQSELNDKICVIQKLTCENTKLKISINKLTNENFEYSKENADLSAVTMRREQVIRNCRCGELLQQNKVLQEIVKSLRKEKDDMSNGEIAEAEKRVERVENLLGELKKAMIENARDLYT